MLGPSLVVARREIKDTVSDWRVITPMVILAIAFPVILVSGMKMGVPYMEKIDPAMATEKAALFGAMMAAFFPISFSLVIALESFVGEKERNTLEALLATPLSDTQMFLGKFIAVMVPPAFLSLVGLIVFDLGLKVLLDMSVTTSFLILALGLSFVEALAMVAGAVVVSSQTASVRAANLLASFIIIPVALAVQGEVMLLLLGYSHILWFALIEFTLVGAVLMKMGINVFNREDILTRENDDPNLGVVWRTLVRYWHSLPRVALGEEVYNPPFSLLRLYFKDIPQLLSTHKGPLGVATLTLAASLAMGYFFALQHPFPLEKEDLPFLARKERLSEVAASISGSWIFFHNFRALALGALFSVFTFGVASLAVIVGSFAVLGFLIGQAVWMGLDLVIFLTAFVLPHGILEVPTAIITGAFSLRLGMSLMAPPKGFNLGDSLMLAWVNWIKMSALFLPLLLAAAYVEANITPQIALALYQGTP